MNQDERQALAVAANLQGLAKQYAERRRHDIALALCDSALQWAKRAGDGKTVAEVIDQLLRERAVLRQEQARQYDTAETPFAVTGGK